MPEEPIKLFASRAERYPEADAADIAEAGARAGLNLIPLVGGAVSDLFSVVLAPSLARRRDEWFKELAKGLDTLEKQAEGFKIENLVQNEAFVSATIQATRIAIGTHQREKREMLRNALLKVAIGKGPDEELQQVYWNAIEAYSPSHVKVLKALRNCTQELIEKGQYRPSHPSSVPCYRNVLALLIPELKAHENLVVSVLTDLRNRGFSKLAGLDVPFPSEGMVTALGNEFLKFVLAEPTKR